MIPFRSTRKSAKKEDALDFKIPPCEILVETVDLSYLMPEVYISLEEFDFVQDLSNTTTTDNKPIFTTYSGKIAITSKNYQDSTDNAQKDLKNSYCCLKMPIQAALNESTTILPSSAENTSQTKNFTLKNSEISTLYNPKLAPKNSSTSAKNSVALAARKRISERMRSKTHLSKSRVKSLRQLAILRSAVFACCKRIMSKEEEVVKNVFTKLKENELEIAKYIPRKKARLTIDIKTDSTAMPVKPILNALLSYKYQTRNRIY